MTELNNDREWVSAIRRAHPEIPQDMADGDIVRAHNNLVKQGAIKAVPRPLPAVPKAPVIAPSVPVEMPSLGAVMAQFKPAAAPASSLHVGAEPSDYSKPIGEATREFAGQVGKKAVAMGKGLVHEVKEDIVSLPKAVAILSQPGALARIYAQLKVLPEQSPVRKEAEQQLDALARAGAVTASTVAAIFTGGATKTLPWILRAATEGAAAGGTYAGTKASLKGEPLPEVLGETGQGAVTGAIAGPAIGAAVRGLGKLAGVARRMPAEAPAPVEAPAAPIAEVPAPRVRFSDALAEQIRARGVDPDALFASLRKDVQDAVFDRAAKKFAPEEMAALERIARTEVAAPSLAPLPAVEPAPTVELPTPALMPASEGAPASVVARLTQAIKAAEPIRAKQMTLSSQERSKRLGAAMGAMENVRGEKGYFAALGQLKGVLPKAEFESVRGLFEQGEINALFDAIGDSPLSGFEKVHAMDGLQKLLGMHGASGVPAMGELQVLKQVFGPELVDAAMSKRTLMGRIGHELADVLNVPRTLLTSFDLSAPGRQGFLLVKQPEFWRNLGPMLRAFKSEKVYRAMMDEIASRPSFKLMKDVGVSFTDVEGRLGPAEEAFMTKLVNKIPGVKHSAQAYTAYLNRLRADSFERLVKQSEAAGVDVTDGAFLESVARYVNAATGRGELHPNLVNSAKVLNGALFSPRLMASRISTFNPRFYMGLHPAVRRAAIRTNLSAFAAAGTLVGLAAMIPGVRVVADPRSADWGKIKLGNTRLDLFAGHQQIIRASAQLLTGVSVSSTTGREMKLDQNDQYRGLNRWDIIQRFLESKTSPVASFVLTMLRGKTFTGEKFDLGKETLTRLIPMTIQDTYDAVVEHGAAGLAVAPVAGVGLGVATYGAPGDRLHFGQPVIEFKTSKGKIARGIIPRDSAKTYLEEMQGAEAKALERLAGSPGFMALTPDKQDAKLHAVVQKYRMAVRARWIRQNGALLAKAAATGKSVTLVPPPSKTASVFGLDDEEVRVGAAALRADYAEIPSDLTDAQVVRAHKRLFEPEMDEEAYAEQLRRMIDEGQ